MPGDTAGMGDWLVPYETGGGPNDVTGLMIDSQTALSTKRPGWIRRMTG